MNTQKRSWKQESFEILKKFSRPFNLKSKVRNQKNPLIITLIEDFLFIQKKLFSLLIFSFAFFSNFLTIFSCLISTIFRPLKIYLTCMIYWMINYNKSFSTVSQHEWRTFRLKAFSGKHKATSELYKIQWQSQESLDLCASWYWCAERENLSEEKC